MRWWWVSTNAPTRFCNKINMVACKCQIWQVCSFVLFPTPMASPSQWGGDECLQMLPPSSVIVYNKNMVAYNCHRDIKKNDEIFKFLVNFCLNILPQVTSLSSWDDDECQQKLPPSSEINWAASWQNQQNDCAPSKDSDQPGHPPSLIRVFAVRSIGSLGFKLSSCWQRRHWSDWADAQADLRLRWAHSHFVGFVMRRLNCYSYGGIYGRGFYTSGHFKWNLRNKSSVSFINFRMKWQHV